MQAAKSNHSSLSLFDWHQTDTEQPKGRFRKRFSLWRDSPTSTGDHSLAFLSQSSKTNKPVCLNLIPVLVLCAMLTVHTPKYQHQSTGTRVSSSLRANSECCLTTIARAASSICCSWLGGNLSVSTPAGIRRPASRVPPHHLRACVPYVQVHQSCSHCSESEGCSDRLGKSSCQ